MFGQIILRNSSDQSDESDASAAKGATGAIAERSVRTYATEAHGKSVEILAHSMEAYTYKFCSKEVPI